MKKVVNKTYVSFLIAFGFMSLGALSLTGLIYVIEDNAVTLRDRVSAIAYEKAQEKERYETERLLEETKDERAELSSIVLTEESVIDFITSIENIAGSSGLNFKTQTITPEATKDKNFDELSIKFNFSGSRSSVEYMMSVFETVPYHSYIRELSIRQSEAENIWTVEMVLVVTIIQHDT